MVNDSDQVNTGEPLPCFEENHDLKYLSAELNKRGSLESRVLVYIQYLNCCKFNTRFSPEGVITFNQDEAEKLGSWAADTKLGYTSNATPEVHIDRTSN